MFDDFVIYHYWNPKASDIKDMSHDEEAKMRDPVLFGFFKNEEKQSEYIMRDDKTRLYFIADWEDEFCTLTFDQMLEAIGKDEDEVTISSTPSLS